MTNIQAAAPNTGIDPRYAIVFGACLTQFLVIGLLFSYGLFFSVFEDEFGWSRTVLSGCSSLAFLMMGVFAVGAGRLNDHYGPKIVLGFTGVACGIGYALMSQVTQPWQLFAIFGIFIGLGMSTHDVVTLSTIARWFKQRRGAMTGIVKVGTAAGQISVPPITALLIAGFGWRSALVIMGLAAALLLLIAALSMKMPPKPDTATAAAPPDGMDERQARRTRTFWTLCAIQFTFLTTLTTVPLHIVVHGKDLGLTLALASGLVSVVGAASVVGRLTIGTLMDRIGGKRAFILCFVPLIASLGALLMVETRWPLYVVMVVYGFGHGGLFTVVSPVIVEYFGLRAHSAIFGTVLFFGTLGGASGPILAGWVFDTTGSYALAFSGLAGLAAAGLMLVLSLPKPKT